MKCWQCETEARGACRFCNRAVCKGDDCVQLMPYILTVYIGEGQIPKVITVGDVLWCGQCKPQPSPIPMPEIY